jgi:uncharacterized membrane protein
MEKGIQVHQSLVINLPAQEVFAFWRRLADFPRFMRDVRSVEELDATRFRWTIDGPGGKPVTWDAEIVDEQPGRVLAWRTIGHSDIRHGGRVEFSEATGGRGTVVTIQMSYESPVGAIGPLLAGILGDDPETQIKSDLRRFKQLVETGEIPTIEGQSSGREEKEEGEALATRDRKPTTRKRRREKREEAAP